MSQHGPCSWSESWCRFAKLNDIFTRYLCRHVIDGQAVDLVAWRVEHGSVILTGDPVETSAQGRASRTAGLNERGLASAHGAFEDQTYHDAAIGIYAGQAPPVLGKGV